MKNINIKIVLMLSAFALILSCSEDDFTGDSSLVATSPSLNVDLGFANSQTLIEQEVSYPFTVTISEPQIANVVVYLKQTGGTATEGADFTFPHTVTIPARSTSASGMINILADDLIEDTETAIITIGLGNESNVDAVNGQTVTFNIMNLTEGDLGIGMSWATSIVTDDTGAEISATAFADLRLLVSNGPNNTDLVGGSDGGSFESYSFSGDNPDGDYYVVADFYDAVDIERDIDITLEFDQVGVINGQTHVFPAALNNASVCPANFVVLAKLTKSGDSYSFEEIGERNFVTTNWPGIDVYDFYAPDGWPSRITSTVDCDGTYLLGLNAEWMFEVWGEEIQEEGKVYFTIDAAGVITIPSQYLFTTLYSGALYDYTVSGTGTYDDSGAAPVIHLEYVMDQDGFDVGAYWNSAGGMDTPYWVADIMAE